MCLARRSLLCLTLYRFQSSTPPRRIFVCPFAMLDTRTHRPDEAHEFLQQRNPIRATVDALLAPLSQDIVAPNIFEIVLTSSSANSACHSPAKPFRGHLDMPAPTNSSNGLYGMPLPVRLDAFFCHVAASLTLILPKPITQSLASWLVI